MGRIYFYKNSLDRQIDKQTDEQFKFNIIGKRRKISISKDIALQSQLQIETMYFKSCNSGI